MEEMTRSMVAPFLDLDGLNKLKEQVHSSLPSPLAPDPIRVQSCVYCLF